MATPAPEGDRSASWRVSRWLIACRWPLLALAFVLSAAAWRAGRSLSFDRSIENMFAADDPVLGPYRKLKRTFGGNEIALAAYVDPDLLTRQGIDRLEKLAQELAGVPGVAGAFSLAEARLILFPPIRLFERLKKRFLEVSEGYTVGADLQTAAIVCVLRPEQASDDRTATVDRLRMLVEQHDSTGVLAGEPVMVVDGFRYLDQDGRLLGTVSTTLLMVTILFFFRSLRWVLVPMAVVGAALVWTQATLVAAGLELSLVSSMLWAIVTVIGIATVVHLVLGFRGARAMGLTPRAALELAGGTLAAPIFWACATDAAGFASLTASDVGPVRDFGLMMLIASLLVLPAIATMVPGLSLMGRLDADPRRAWGEGIVDRLLRRIIDFVHRNPRATALAAGLVGLACSLGVVRLEVETDFTKNFRRSSPIVHSYEFVESRLGGAGVWDIIFPVPEEGDRDVLDRMRRLQARLKSEVLVREPSGRDVPGLTKVLSAADVMDVFSMRAAPGRLEQTLQGLEQRVPIVKYLHGRDPDHPERMYLRIMLRARERQPSAEKERLIAEVRRISLEEFPEAEVTGFFVLLTRLIQSLVSDQWLTF
ncbi:MAG: MMPL family transporter, partial [Pirellulales bacterium]